MADVQYLPTNYPDAKIVSLSYDDLVKGVDLTKQIEEAYGFNGLGLLTVRGVPRLTESRQQLLPLAHKFANLDEEIKKKTEHAESMYSFGWSHGKEKMLEGKPDFSKGSYYNNPIYNKPFDDPELIKKYPAFCHPNIWPTEDMPELEPAFLNMGKAVVEVGLLIAQQCDRYIKSKLPAYSSDKLYNIIKNSKTSKARLLHYFPIDNSEGKEVDVSSWCGWHNDHGSLTGLVPAMYFTKEGKEVPNPDPKAGLYIMSRDKRVIKANMPPDHMGFQIGETACIHSGGLLQATPHCVQGAVGESAKGVSRETFAVFMEPEFHEKMIMPVGTTEDDVIRGSAEHMLPKGVPILAKRWKPSQDFGEFTEKTLSSYY